MKKQSMKGSKGITLVALIITIIVLLILAVVAISAVNNTGIIQYAKNSADEYNDGRDKENTVLGTYLETLKEHEPGEKNNPPESVSIVGTYGNTESTDDEWQYYKFEENGTGEYIDIAGLGQRKKNFSYNLIDDTNGVIIMEDNKEETFVFKVAKDNSGNILNKVVIIDKWSDGTFVAYTINRAIGLTQKIKDGTYKLYDDDTYQGDISIKDGNNITLKIPDSDLIIPIDFGEYFVLEDYIYQPMDNCFGSCYKIEGDKIIDLSS